MASPKTKRPRCTSTTADGSPCTNKAKAGSDRCGALGGKIGAPIKLPSDRCIGGDEPQTYTQAIAGLASIGLTRNRIARQLQMAPTTIASWKERGEADFEADALSEFRDFYLRFEASRANFVTKQLQRIDKAGKDGDWRAAAEALKIVLRDEFGPKAQLEVSGEINIVEQHVDQFLGVLMPFLADLDVADDPRLPDLIEKYFTPLERDA